MLVDPKADEKLAELMLYVADKCMGMERFGATKLNKILWMADFTSYRRRGRGITNADYFRLPRGPAPRRLVPVRDQLEAQSRAVLRERTLGNRVQKRLIPLVDPDLSYFDGQDIAIVDEIIDLLRDKSADEVSEISHLFAGWELAGDCETIPYDTVLIDTEPFEPTPEDYARAIPG